MRKPLATILGSLASFCLIAGLALPALATENGASVWPVGAEGFATAAGVPQAGRTTMYYNYTLFYLANRMNDAQGKSAVLDFRLRVLAEVALG